MAPLSDFVLISVVCAVTIFLSVLLVTILFLRYRRKNILHSNGPNPNLYPQSRGLFRSTIPFPYAGTRQWSAISSSENIHEQVCPDILEPPPCHSSERRFSRMSTPSTRNSRRLQKKSSRDIALEPMVSPSSFVGPSDVKNIDSFPQAIAELRADSTPRMKQHLQHDDNTNDGDAGGRVTSWPLTTRKGSYYDITATMRGGPSVADSRLAKRRSEGILRRVPGSPPKHGVPPLPAFHPPGVPHLTRHDSLLLSNKSLDTAGSSILDDPVGESLNESDELEAARELRLRTHGRYTSAGGWWLPASTRSGSASRIPQAPSPYRYRSTSASSYKLSDERGSPRRNASTRYPERSSQISGVQSPISPRKLHVPSFGLSRYLSGGPWIQSNTRNQVRQPPPIYELNTASSPERDHRSGQGQADSIILKPITDNGKNGGSRPPSNTNGYPSKRAHDSSSSRPSTFAKTSVEEQKKGQLRRKSVRVSINQQNLVPPSMLPTIEEPEDSSCKSTPQAKTVTSICQDETFETPPTTEDSQNPFDKDEPKQLPHDEGSEPIHTPIEQGSAKNNLSAASPSSVPKSPSSPNDERPSIPRRSSLRRNSSTGLRSPHQAQSLPTRSASVTSPVTTPTSQHFASTPSTSSTTKTTNSVSDFPNLEGYSNVRANIDSGSMSWNNNDRPARNAFALRENSPLMDQETDVAKPRPLPVLPLLKLTQPPPRSRTPKFRVALTTIKSASNIAMHDDSDGAGCEDSNKENDGDDGNGTLALATNPSQQHFQLDREEATGSSIQREGTASPSDKHGIWTKGALDLTPLKAGTGEEPQQLTSSMARTPGSMYDQFGFLME